MLCHVGFHGVDEVLLKPLDSATGLSCVNLSHAVEHNSLVGFLASDNHSRVLTSLSPLIPLYFTLQW